MSSFLNRSDVKSSDLKSDLLTASDREPALVERRAATRRRVKRDRRKGVYRSVGIDISPSGVVMAVIEESVGKSKLIVERITFPPESGPRRGDWADDTLSDVLIEMAAKHNLGGQAVVVGLGGDPCMTRVVAGDNEEVDNEIVELTGRSQRYIGMGLGDKISCKSTHRIDAKRKRVCVTIAMRDMVDAVATAVQNAGMRLAYLEHTMLVLCRILHSYDNDIDEPVLFIVDDLGRIDLGISYQGRLLLDYRPAMPEASYTGRSLVQRHLKSLRRYIQAQLPGVSSDLTKIFVTGGKVASESLYLSRGTQSSLRRCHFPLFELCTGLEVDGEVTEDVGVISAVGLARLNRDGKTQQEKNDLVATLRTDKKVHWWPFVKQTWPLALAASLALMLTLLGNRSSQIAEQTRARIDELTNENAEGNQIRLTLHRIMQRNQQIEKLGQAIVQPDWAHVFVKAGTSLPDGAWLESIRVDHDSTVKISGVSRAGEAVYEYIERLRQTGLFTRVALESTSASRSASGPEYRFDVSAAYLITAPNGSGDAVATVVPRRTDRG